MGISRPCVIRGESMLKTIVSTDRAFVCLFLRSATQTYTITKPHTLLLEYLSRKSVHISKYS
jgi:hypothetical protein